MQETTTERSLYEKLGGDAFLSLMVSSYFDELVEDEVLGKFFKHVSVTALKAHLFKFFQVCFGREADLAAPDDMTNYLLTTHTRLFREMDLDETHFDRITQCFARSLQSFLTEQKLIDDAVAVLLPLRPIFKRGAEIAREEKAMSDEQLKLLPEATAKSFSQEDMAQKLPEFKVDVPEWLPAALLEQVTPKRYSKQDVVRAWTCQLTEAFARDKKIADTFLDMSYLRHHAYQVAFLSLAFGGEQEEGAAQFLQSVRFPRGRHLPELTRSLFGHMVKHFEVLCTKMSLDKEIAVRCLEQLDSYRLGFLNGRAARVGWTPHAIHPSRKKMPRRTTSPADLGSACRSAASSSSRTRTSGGSTSSIVSLSKSTRHQLMGMTTANSSASGCDDSSASSWSELPSSRTKPGSKNRRWSLLEKRKGRKMRNIIHCILTSNKKV